MRLLLALLMALPLLAQQAEEKKPQAAAPQAEAKPEAKAAEPPAPTPPLEQNITGSIDFGYRWVGNVGGNAESYRSIVNLGEGPKLSGWDFSIVDPKKHYFD